MCSIRCRNSKSLVCKCECGGLFHGGARRGASQHASFLNNSFPPCTPVRFITPTLRGTKQGRVKRFGNMGIRTVYVELQSGEVVKIQNIDAVGVKNETNKQTKKRRAHC